MSESTWSVHLGGGDRLEPGRVGEGELDPQCGEDVGGPVPGAGGLHDGPVGPGELDEILLEPEARARNAGLFDAPTVGPVGCDDAERPVLVDARVPHGSALLG
ncbi:MAG: hypothetical protein ACRDIC_15975 [bacterium]